MVVVVGSFSRNILSVVLSLLWVIHSVVSVGQPASQFDIQQHKQQHQQDRGTDGWTDGQDSEVRPTTTAYQQ